MISRTQPSIIIALIPSNTYVVGLKAAADSSHPFRAYLGVKVGAKNNAGKNKKVAACAPCEEPDLTPAATEYPANPMPQKKAIPKTAKYPANPAGSAPIRFLSS